MSFEAVEREFDTAVSRRVFPGAVLLVRDGERVYHRAFGHRSLEPSVTPMQSDTIFDLSSLTKPLATCPSKASALSNHPSKRWPCSHSRSKTIIAQPDLHLSEYRTARIFVSWGPWHFTKWGTVES